MNTKVEETLVETLNKLKKKGYTHDFEIRKNCLYCLTDKKEIGVNDFEVDETFRFEGMTNPGDSSILYSATTADGMKGTFVDNYSIDATTISKEMKEKLKFKLGEGTVRPEDI